MRTTVLALGCMILLSACVTSGTQVREQNLTGFQKGLTTETDITKALGTPQSITKNADGSKTLIYSYTHAQTKGASFIPVVGLFAGGAKGETESAVFKLDLAGKLLDYSTSAADINVRTNITGATTESTPK